MSQVDQSPREPALPCSSLPALSGQQTSGSSLCKLDRRNHLLEVWFESECEWCRLSARLPKEKRAADLPLKTFDRVCERRLRNPATLCGAAEILLLAQGEEADILKFHDVASHGVQSQRMFLLQNATFLRRAGGALCMAPMRSSIVCALPTAISAELRGKIQTAPHHRSRLLAQAR